MAKKNVRNMKVCGQSGGLKLLCDKHNCLCYYKNDISENDFCGNVSIVIFFYPYTSYNGNEYLQI